MSHQTIIAPKHGRPTDEPAKGRCRRLMQTRIVLEKHRKRAQVETVMSMIKRRQESFCKGKTYRSRCRELSLMVLTHNIMILLPRHTFLHSLCAPFCLVLCVASLCGLQLNPSLESAALIQGNSLFSLPVPAPCRLHRSVCPS